MFVYWANEAKNPSFEANNFKLWVRSRILLFMNEINLTLYLTDEHFKYMENLVKKQYGENVTIKFSNDSKYCFCSFYDNLSIVKVFNLSFNNKQVKNIGNIKFDNSFFCDEQLWKI